MDFWSRLEDVQNRWNVLQHPMYQRWSAGELSREELSFYGGQYRHAVVALAQASANAAQLADVAEEKAELEAHAQEEFAHISLWDDFAQAVGSDLDAEPTTETAACAVAWSGADRDLAGQLMALYAIESAQPAISETKAAGLKEFYGFKTGSGTAYFDIHSTRDCEHSAHARALLSKRLGECDQEGLLGVAESVLSANWKLLDGVDRVFDDSRVTVRS